PHVGIDDTGIGAAEQPLVESLQRELARLAPRRFRRRAARAGAGALDARRLFVRAHDSSSSRLAISTATRAASRPFSSARACACAVVSQVRMALAMARP